MHSRWTAKNQASLQLYGNQFPHKKREPNKRHTSSLCSSAAEPTETHATKLKTQANGTRPFHFPANYCGTGPGVGGKRRARGFLCLELSLSSRTTCRTLDIYADPRSSMKGAAADAPLTPPPRKNNVERRTVTGAATAPSKTPQRTTSNSLLLSLCSLQHWELLWSPSPRPVLSQCMAHLSYQVRHRVSLRSRLSCGTVL